MSGALLIWLAEAISPVVQRVAMARIGLLSFGERLTGMQAAGVVPGIVAVALIAWPQGVRG